ncbi:TSUP family transporter [Anaerocolumna sp. AGMB13020]|uniref:sulfite exporter TauE/SafE family protein n=1 Tax=Anaerocolumna sp. AGMB13020 TaxID=3081750 RepID=UPI0029547724|nr:TSUP family transporter [Anaerocolumna sp. AGMB13020]WOO38149.1 TSUP family transporter [Anaerocolumna sp. AGMB13020]
MEISLITFLIVCPLVFLAGVIDSIAGGGGLISLPAYLIAGIPPHYALGTNKLSSCIGTFASTARYIKNKSVNYRIGAVSVILALAGSFLGANLALMVSESVIKNLLLFVLPFTAFFVLKNKKTDDNRKPLSDKLTFLIACTASFVIAVYDGFYGPGTGTFLLLCYTVLARMDIKTASGNTKIVNLSSNIAAVVTFLLHGKVVFLLGLTAAIFSIAGHYIGSGLVLKKGYKIVKPVMLVVLALLFLTILTER